MPAPKGAACPLSWREAERGEQNEGCGLGELSFIGLIRVFKACNSSHPHKEVLSSTVGDVKVCCNASVSPGGVCKGTAPNPSSLCRAQGGGFSPSVGTHKCLSFVGVEKPPILKPLPTPAPHALPTTHTDSATVGESQTPGPSSGAVTPKGRTVPFGVGEAGTQRTPRGASWPPRLCLATTRPVIPGGSPLPLRLGFSSVN